MGPSWSLNCTSKSHIDAKSVCLWTRVSLDRQTDRRKQQVDHYIMALSLVASSNAQTSNSWNNECSMKFHEVPKRNSQVITPGPLSSEKELNQIQLIFVCFIWRPSDFAQQNYFLDYFIILSPKLKFSFQRTGPRTGFLVLLLMCETGTRTRILFFLKNIKGLE
jgi:hypothetical protein